MDKKYKIFISSTCDDLLEERKKIRDTLLSMGCIPLNMETFFASDIETWEFIENVLSTCDYYVIILAARYGSIFANTKKSFTQMEYEYAQKNNIPIGRFLYENPDNLPFNKHDLTEDNRNKFYNFRNDVQKGKIVKYWTNPDELSCLVAVAVHQFIMSDYLDNFVINSEVLRNRGSEIFSKLNMIESIVKKSFESNIFDSKNNSIELLIKDKKIVIDKDVLNEIANITLSEGFNGVADFLNIKIAALPIKTYIDNDLNDFLDHININNQIVLLCEFEGPFHGQIILKIEKYYLSYIYNSIMNNYLIDITKFDYLFIKSFIGELGSIFFSASLTYLSFLLKLEKKYFIISRIIDYVSFDLFNNSINIFELSSSKYNILKSYLLLDNKTLDIISAYAKLL